MDKQCIACDYQPEPSAKPDDQPEDCPKCHAVKSVQVIDDDEEDAAE